MSFSSKTFPKISPLISPTVVPEPGSYPEKPDTNPIPRSVLKSHALLPLSPSFSCNTPLTSSACLSRTLSVLSAVHMSVTNSSLSLHPPHPPPLLPAVDAAIRRAVATGTRPHQTLSSSTGKQTLPPNPRRGRRVAALSSQTQTRRHVRLCAPNVTHSLQLYIEKSRQIFKAKLLLTRALAEKIKPSGPIKTGHRLFES